MSKQASPTFLLVLLCAVLFITMVMMLMLGPLLVELAVEFDTSVAVAGQLIAVTAIALGVTAPLAGPFSDSYGRRPLLLIGLIAMTLGLLGSAFAWDYSSLLMFRLLTGAGAAMINPNCIAIIADVFPAEERGKAIGWTISATGMGAAVGVAIVAFLLGLGDWQLPFIVIGLTSLLLCLLLWVWLPLSQQTVRQSLSFFSHYKEVGSNPTFWYVLVSHALLNMSFIGVFSYLAANLIQHFGMTPGETALPLALAGSGLIAGGFVGGRVADHRHKISLLAIFALAGALAAGLVFTTLPSPWIVVTLAFGVGCMTRVSMTVTPNLLIELAGNSRTTATGLFAVSNQVGAIGGASIGGTIMAVAGFPAIGFFCASVSVIAAIIVATKVRRSKEFQPQLTLRESEAL